MPSQTGAGNTQKRHREDPPLLPPRLTVYDPDWHEKIETARRAHDDARKAREGKPATFSTYLTVSQTSLHR